MLQRFQTDATPEPLGPIHEAQRSACGHWPPRPQCQCPLHTSCDPATILQVHPSSKQSTQPCSPADHGTHAPQQCSAESCPPWLSPLPQPHSLLIPVCHQGCSPGGLAKRPPCQMQLVLLRFLLHYLCGFRHSLFFEIATPSGLPPTFSASFRGSSSISCPLLDHRKGTHPWQR